MSESTQTTQVVPPEDGLDPLAPPPDDENPALFDAEKTYVITVLSSILFCGAIIVFILL
mgnify:CR=1 FL=1